jgi:nucleoside-diphosphate-sugar epimerase
MASDKKAIRCVGITGAAGNIAKTLIEGLADKYEFSLFDYRTDSEHLEQHTLPFRKVDVSQANQLKGIFRGLDAVIHLAAASTHRAPWNDVLDKNIVGTYNVFEEVRQSGVGKIVFASSNHVHQGHCMLDDGTSIDASYVATNGRLRISDPPAPDSYYGVSKLFGEDLGYYYWRLFGIRFVALRIGSTHQEDRPILKGSVASQDYSRAMFLSKRDCVQIFDLALQTNKDYLVAYAVSNNDSRIYDLTETAAALGFDPKDNSEAFCR